MIAFSERLGFQVGGVSRAWYLDLTADASLANDVHGWRRNTTFEVEGLVNLVPADGQLAGQPYPRRWQCRKPKVIQAAPLTVRFGVEPEQALLISEHGDQVRDGDSWQCNETAPPEVADAGSSGRKPPDCGEERTG